MPDMTFTDFLKAASAHPEWHDDIEEALRHPSENLALEALARLGLSYGYVFSVDEARSGFYNHLATLGERGDDVLINVHGGQSGFSFTPSTTSPFGVLMPVPASASQIAEHLAVQANFSSGSSAPLEYPGHSNSIHDMMPAPTSTSPLPISQADYDAYMAAFRNALIQG